MYARDEESGHEAEFPIIVEDEWQARGLGTLLLFEIADEARRAGVEAVAGVVCPHPHLSIAMGSSGRRTP